jgi:hypothetical protein
MNPIFMSVVPFVTIVAIYAREVICGFPRRYRGFTGVISSSTHDLQPLAAASWAIFPSPLPRLNVE